MPDIELLDNPEEDTQTELQQPREFGRDPFQQKRDAELLEKVNQWKAAGSPAPIHDQATNTLKPNPEAPYVRYTVDKKNLPDIRGAVRRAATLHKVDVIWYKDQKNASGTVTVKASPMAQPTKEELAAKKAARDAAKAAANGQPAQPEGGQPEGDQPEGDQGHRGRPGR